jgi:hypothetical protein
MQSFLSLAFGFRTTVFETVVEPVVAVTGWVCGKLPRATCICQQRFESVRAYSAAVRTLRIAAAGPRSYDSPMYRPPTDRWINRRASSVNG